MTGSLDELIQFLLHEIALSGQQGSTPADILDFVSQFYKYTSENAAFLQHDLGPAQRADHPTIDRAFQEQVWRWLTRHPDVHIGSDRRGNKMPLPAAKDPCLTKRYLATLEAAKDISTSSIDPDLDVQQHQSSSNGSWPQPAKKGDQLRIYVTEERMWLAICGHPKDLTKVFETEFALLSIIAAHRERGILQGHLVKESTQDKRSVPKRTDALRDKGYIEKQVVHLKGLKTSRLVLRRFASNVASDLITPNPISHGSPGTVYGECLDFNVLIPKLFTILKRKELVTRGDLKKELDMRTKWRARMLARMIRKLEVIGCLKRVKAASEASKSVRYYFDCVKLIHEPSERDLKGFDISCISLKHEHTVEEPDFEGADDAGEVRQKFSADRNQVEEMERIVPQWNPDRSLANFLVDLVHSAGTQGFTNRELRNHVMGTFVRRPVEHLLTKLTALWLQSQPSHLRHLAIVRDTVLSGTIPLYVQYSLPNFEARVASGHAFWEAVKEPTIDGGKKGKKRSTDITTVSSTDPELDEYGFPATYSPSLQYKDARGTLGQCLLAAQPGDLPFSNRDPLIYRNKSGAYMVKYDAAETHPNIMRPVGQNAFSEESVSPSSQPKTTTKKGPQPRQPGAKPRGRPRKFLRGTEKFWQGQFAMARKLANSDPYDPLGIRPGVMSDHVGLSLFAKRPPQFDPVLVWALENGLPVPAKPKDITQEWVDRMLPLLNRTAPGVYITPKGVRHQEAKKHRSASRLVVFRSSRLGELDFSNKRVVPCVRFLASSAAHTFADVRNEFLGQTMDDSEDDALSSRRVRLQNPITDLKHVANERREPLHASVPHTSDNECDGPPPEQEADMNAPTSEVDRWANPREKARTTTPERALPDERALKSHSQILLEGLALPASPIPDFALPSSLSSRSIHEDQSGGQPVLPLNEVHIARGPAVGEKSDDQPGTLLGGTPPEVQPMSSMHLDKLVTCEVPDKTRRRSKRRPITVVAVEGNSLSNVANTLSTRDEVYAAAGHAPDNLVPRLSSSGLPSPKSQTAPLGSATDSEKLDISGTANSDFTPLKIDERRSEAFRLVQELTTNWEGQPCMANEATFADDQRQSFVSVAPPNNNGYTTLPGLRISEIHTDSEPPRKRNKQNGVGAGSIALLRRKIMLDLIEACDGALPYYTNPLLNAFTTAWQKAGQSGKPDLRTLKTVVKSLCQNGSTKQVKFSHRNKKGTMVTKTILAKSDIAISDQVILETQKRMMEADPRQYLPQPFENCSDLKRDMGKQTSTLWPAVYEEQTVESSVTPAKVLRLQLRETLSRARKRRSAIESDGQDVLGGHAPQSDNVVHRARLVGIGRKYSTDPEPYIRPKLSMYHAQSPHQSILNQLAEPPTTLQFRTEIPQAPLTFEALARQKRPSPRSRAELPSHISGDANPASRCSSIAITPQISRVRPTSTTWKNIGDQPVLPSSLEDILIDDRRRKKPDHAEYNDSSYCEFECQIEAVARWEQSSFNTSDFESKNWVFINHLVGHSFQAAPESKSTVTFVGLIWYDDRGREHTEKRFHLFDQSILGPVVKGRPSLLQRSHQKVVSQAQPQLHVARALRKRKRISLDPLGVAKKRRRHSATVTQPQTITDSAGNLIDVSHLIGAKYKRPRGIQHLRTMPKHFIYRLTIAVVVVRALMGGLEKHVDWPLVRCVFPDEDEQFLKDRWKTLSNKHRRDIDQLVENFQDRFPEAYANGEVPQINFDDPESVDWKTIVKWAIDRLDKPIMHEMPDLPATRSEFDETVNMRIESSQRPYRDLLGYNQAITVPVKEVAISAIPFAVPLPLPPQASHTYPSHLPDPTDDTSDTPLMLAKSWALSTITTPLDTFDPVKAHCKLQSLAPTARESERLIGSAMKSLTTARAFAKKREKGIDAKGRSYDLSRVFTDTMDQRRTINATMLKQAVRYKTTVLDPAFSKGGIVRFEPVTVEDGDMVAILNLVAHRKIKIKTGNDVSRNRWGIDQESKYQTRKMHRESLYFTVLVVQIPGEYVFGNPLLEHDVPIPDLGTGARDMIPIWRDIHGGFQRKNWDLAVAAVLGILASRSGASVREVAKTMSPTLGAWEVECLLTWCFEVGAVKKTGESEGGWTGGWEVREWWWMVLECGRVENMLDPARSSALD